MAEPVAMMSILAYITQLVSELDITGGDQRKVGYYVGIIVSVFYATQSIMTLQWSSASDHVGRKPILLLGLLGSMASMLLFGLSRTFLGLVFSQCLAGFFGGNIGVLRSALGDITDSTNRVEGFTILPVFWSVGEIIGPILGGYLARPHKRFPETFTINFWVEYPYFLPCAAVAGILLLSFLVTVVCFKETAPSQSRVHVCGNDGSISMHIDKPLPFRDILVYPVLISVANYGTLSFLSIILLALLPLFLGMPTRLGGMGASSAVIGDVLSFVGALDGILQFFCFAWMVRRFGERWVFIIAMSTFPIIFALFPILSIVLKNNGSTWFTWTLLVILLVLRTLRETGFNCIFLYITAAAPNKRSLGFTNGLAQTTVAFLRAVGPALSTSLFSWSMEKNLLGGYAVYVLLFLCACSVLPLAARLPERPWENE
ncbi:hypothetical protein AMATHDRAFT_59769 [Amanita thiersii Skay4041]|uniref:Major facilitator superfamily (MFS) profile domain-containing protein n=1 Tax=Amanita thiersii Skay4041 TaxID=703135 RepID=A0A2A9NTQ0_9AGAR|nr:hypothetical protein AMATHDRAFT_59769 [Amanita thiersii Skay4041]